MSQMSAPAIDALTGAKIDEFFQAAIAQHIPAALTTFKDRWSIFSVEIAQNQPEGLTLRLLDGADDALRLQSEQPVGFRLEYDHDKYIFDSFIIDPPTLDCPIQLTIDRPAAVERLPRRAYERQAIPPELTVRALLWNRGFLDKPQLPVKEQYWQGKLINLSVSGALISLPYDPSASFSNCQLLGVQFTPMCHQKPVLLEALVRHYQTPEDDPYAYLGLEFIGLEATPEGRELMRCLAQVVEDYKTISASARS